jgi:UDP-glucose 4-epimerase
VRRVLVTGGQAPLARAIAAHLASCEATDAVLLADHPRPQPLPHIRVVPMGGRGYEDVRDIVNEHQVDTVVHCALAPDRSGALRRDRDAGVIATMQVAAVASDLSGPVRTMVAVSSTARYRASSDAPVVHGEDLPSHRAGGGTYRASLAEAEDYLLALAEQRPNLAVAILRLADLAGPGVTGPLADLLAGPLVPRLPGFDPLVQFLHVDDAVRAVEHTCERALAGAFNVASVGVVRWSRAIRSVGRLPYWTIAPAAEPLESAMRAVGFRPLHADLFSTLRYGRVASTDRLEATGFTAAHTVDDCLRSLRNR